MLPFHPKDGYLPYDFEDRFNLLDKEYKLLAVRLTNSYTSIFNTDAKEMAHKILFDELVSKEKKLPIMVSIQNVYNLVNRVFDIANSEVSLRENCGLLAYSPLAGGRLSGKYLNEQNSSRRNGKMEKKADSLNYESIRRPKVNSESWMQDSVTTRWICLKNMA